MIINYILKKHGNAYNVKHKPFLAKKKKKPYKIKL